MRRLGLLTAVVLLWATPAHAVPARQCPSIAVSGTTYVVTAHGVTCGYARKWVRKYLQAKAHPKRWKCTPPTGETNVRVNCHGATKPKNDAAFRYYYGIKTRVATAAHAGHAPPTVNIALHAYDPRSITVVEGDVIQWNWAGPDVNHSVTSDAGTGESFDSKVPNKQGLNYTYYFAKAGTYTYHCSVHSDMHGTIIVQPGTQYDTTAPVLSRVRLASASRRRATVSFRVSENASVATRVRRRGSSKVLRDAFSFVSAGDAKASVGMAGLPHGRYVVSVRVQDATGNKSATKTVPVKR